MTDPTEGDVGKVTLLLAEDEMLVHLVLEEALAEAGFSSVMVSDGAAAMAELETDPHRFSAVVTDIRLGSGPSGWDIGHRARELIPEMPVVYMSGDSAREWTAHGVPNSIMLSKPFVMAQLITAIAQLISAMTPGGPTPA